MTECKHEKRYLASTENYQPAGIIEYINCYDCRQLVGEIFTTSEGRFVNGLEANFEIKLERIYVPSFKVK